MWVQFCVPQGIHCNVVQILTEDSPQSQMILALPTLPHPLGDSHTPCVPAPGWKPVSHPRAPSPPVYCPLKSPGLEVPTGSSNYTCPRWNSLFPSPFLLPPQWQCPHPLHHPSWGLRIVAAVEFWQALCFLFFVSVLLCYFPSMFCSLN